MSRVHVCVRVRPALPREIKDGAFHGAVGLAGTTKLFITTSDKPVVVREDEEQEGVRRFEFARVFSGDASNAEVYGECDQSVQRVVDGFNATVFAYGQTGTGKTHTISGTPEDPGLILRAAHALFASPKRLDISFSVAQIYRAHITDLLSDRDAPLALREGRDGDGSVGVYLDGQVKSPVACVSDVVQLLHVAQAKRAVANTKLNTGSSRSHAIATFHVTSFPGDAEEGGREGEDDDAESVHATEAKLHVVDLAGSERVKDSDVAGDDLRDARDINTALFHLIRTVQALTRGDAHVPYKDDRLTFFLKDALGGNCLTTLVATISPAQLHARESLNTLRFAQACTLVTNRASVNAVLKPRPWHAPVQRPQPKPEKPPLPWSGLTVGSPGVPGGRQVVATELGRLSCLVYGDTENPLVVCMHGYPSSAQDTFGGWLVPALVYAGYCVVAVDMPGCGESCGRDFANQGVPLKTRSEYSLKPGGPADLVAALISTLSPNRRAVLLGYDWGGGVALAMAAAKRTHALVSKVVAFHPSYTEPEAKKGKFALDAVYCPTMLVWCKEDQFHNWKTWQVYANRLRSSLGQQGKLIEHVFSAKDHAKHGWHPCKADIEERIVEFLLGRPVVAQPKEVFARPEKEEANTAGVKVTRKDNVVMESDVGGLDRRLFEKSDPALVAVQQFRELHKQGRLPSLYRAFTGLPCAPKEESDGGAAETKRLAQQLFYNLPVLSPEVLGTPTVLCELGLWEAEPRGWASMRDSDRWAAGRQVLVRAGVCPNPNRPGFMQLDPKWAATRFTTHRAVLVEALPEEGFAVVDVEHANGGTQRLRVPWEELSALNDPHAIPEVGNETRLEDGLRCNYAHPLVKARMCEIALVLAPLASALDFGDRQRCEDTQRACVRAIRGCLGLITFQTGAPGGGRDRGRYCQDDVGRFAVFGQGHCHTVSSVMCAFLWPWQRVLGLECKYRGGYTFYRTGGVDAGRRAGTSPAAVQGAAPAPAPAPVDVGKGKGDEEGESAVCVRDDPERHQWLEFTTRPSMASFVCDLWVDEGAAGKGDWLAHPVRSAYTHTMYPNGRLKTMCGYPVRVHPSL